MRRFLYSACAVTILIAPQVVGLTAAHAIGGTPLTDGESMYVLDNGGTSYVATDVPTTNFQGTGNTPLDTANGYDPASMAYDQANGATYALEWSDFGRRIEQVDPATGHRWGSLQIDEPEGYDWIDSIAVSPTGVIYGLGDAGGLYEITLGSTAATLTKIGASSIGSPQWGLAFDATGFLYGYDSSTRDIKVLSLADASTVVSYTTSGLPTGSTFVAAMQIDRSSGPVFWVETLNPSDDLSSLYAGTISGSNIAFTPNGDILHAGTNIYGEVPVYGTALVLAPPYHATSLSHAQSVGQVTFGGSVKLSTTLTDTTTTTPLGGVPVQLQRQSGSSWVAVKSATTGAAGSTSVTLAPTSTTTYRWYAAPPGSKLAYEGSATSGSFTVKVALASGTPTISGTLRAGDSLTAHSGTWKPAGVTFSYQWLLNGKTIAGATKSTLKLSSSWVGRRVAVRVTGSKSGYVSAVRTSASSGVIQH